MANQHSTMPRPSGRGGSLAAWLLTLAVVVAVGVIAYLYTRASTPQLDVNLRLPSSETLPVPTPLPNPTPLPSPIPKPG